MRGVLWDLVWIWYFLRSKSDFDGVWVDRFHDLGVLVGFDVVWMSCL